MLKSAPIVRVLHYAIIINKTRPYNPITMLGLEVAGSNLARAINKLFTKIIYMGHFKSDRID